MYVKAPRVAVFCTGLLLLLTGLLQAQPLDTTKLAGLKARSIGPAGMSGRVTAIDAHHSNPDIMYIGTASGGLWKSTDGGIAFKPIFDDQPVASIGAIAIYQKNPDVIYVGTGEGNPRNSQTNGNGVYKTIDGGRTWTHLGLDASRNIHRIFVHPDNPDVVYVGAQGPAWGETDMRGVFKSTDGGQTWDKILYANERTGIGDLVMDPVNPDKLIAAMWEFRRWPWFFKSGGEASGIYVTHDGGTTWTRRTDKDGLPKGELGRIGLAIAPSHPNIVYALVEAEKNALYRSEDGGVTFSKVNDSRQVSNRPFYYNDVFVDPVNENRIYHVASRLQYSEDGGQTFKPMGSGIHPDHHAWWIDPNNPNLIYEGNDGGMAISRDRGMTWRFIENLPLAQFYHIRVDMSTPYRVCGGLQDNGSWCGPSQVWRAGGIRNSYWEEVAFGDGFDVMIHPEDPNTGYAMSQGGNLRRFDLVTGYTKNIKPMHEDGHDLRFNWNAGIAQDPFDASTIYYGSQHVHKSTDRGDTWTTISPDLTTNDPEKQKQIDSGGLTYDVTGAENFTTIVAIEPSPLERGVLWVGTDDGNVQVTRDGGAAWTNVMGNIRGVPAGTWVPQIRASLHNAAEAFVVFEDHRRNNWEPYVYRTRDYGRTWTRLADANNVWGYALAIAQDPVAPNLLFLGTEFGLYVSIDAGATWTPFTNGFPTASAMDLVIHPRDHDLVVGTFGRSIYILDDIRPLRAMAEEGADILDRPLAVYEAPVAYQAIYRQATGTRFYVDAIFAGENRPRGAMITYSVNPDALEAMAANMDEAERDKGGTEGPEQASNGKEAPDKVKIEIVQDGEVIRTLEGPAEAGINRTYWEMSRKGIRFNFGFRGGGGGGGGDTEPAGADVLPGMYTARISYGDHVDSTMIDVRFDPRMEVNREDLEARLALYGQWEAKAKVLTEATERIGKAKETAETIGKRLRGMGDDAPKELMKQTKDIQKGLDGLTEMFSGPSDVQGIRRDPKTITSQLFTARGYIQSGFNAPDPSAFMALEKAEDALQEALDKVNAFFAEDWAGYRAAVEAANVSLFDAFEPLKL